MGMTDRHKKPGGFRKLVNSLEVTGPDKRTKILDSMRVEDLGFVTDVEKCVFTWNEFINVPDMVVSEILFHVSDYRSLALALYKDTTGVSEKFKKNCPAKQAIKIREEEELLTDVTASQKMAGQFKLIELARKLEHEGKFKLKPYNSKYPD